MSSNRPKNANLIKILRVATGMPLDPLGIVESYATPYFDDKYEEQKDDEYLVVASTLLDKVNQPELQALALGAVHQNLVKSINSIMDKRSKDLNLKILFFEAMTHQRHGIALLILDKFPEILLLESKKEEKSGPLSLDKKIDKAENQLRKLVEILKFAYPEEIKSGSAMDAMKLEKFKRVKASSGLCLDTDSNSALGFVINRKIKSNVNTIIAELFKCEGSTMNGKGWGGGDYRQIGYFLAKTDAAVDSFLKNFAFDVEKFKLINQIKLNNPPGGPALFDKKESKASVLADEHTSLLVAELFQGTSVPVVKIKDDVITFVGDKEDVEKVFLKALQKFKDSGISYETLLMNMELKSGKYYQVNVDVGKLAVIVQELKQAPTP